MAKNKDLILEIEGLAAELKLTVVTTGLNNAKLSALSSDLKAKKRDADNVTPADEAEVKADEEAAAAAEVKADEEAAAAAEVKALPPFYVMPGKSLTTKRGVLGTEQGTAVEDYTEVKAKDVCGGQETIDRLVTSGHIGKN